MYYQSVQCNRSLVVKHPSPLQLDLAAQITDLIRGDSLGANTPLREENLAERFGVSRSPVRAALKLLQHAGHVYHTENAGVFVAPGARRRPRFQSPSSTVTLEGLHGRVISDRARKELGQTVSESELLSRYRVSKSLLGKVLLRLTAEGLIERRKGHGWQFLPTLDTPEAVCESYRFRMIVECAGLREPSFTPDDAELAKIREMHLRFRNSKPGARTASAFFEMNLRFHEMLAEFSGNRFVQQAMEQMNRLRKFEEFAAFLHSSADLQSSVDEHLQVMEAIAQGETEWAATLMHRHLELALRRSLRC